MQKWIDIRTGTEGGMEDLVRSILNLRPRQCSHQQLILAILQKHYNLLVNSRGDKYYLLS